MPLPTQTPTADALARAEQERTDADWQYWQAIIPAAADVAKQIIASQEQPSPEKCQAILAATLNTMEDWLRKDP